MDTHNKFVNLFGQGNGGVVSRCMTVPSVPHGSVSPKRRITYVMTSRLPDRHTNPKYSPNRATGGVRRQPFLSPWFLFLLIQPWQIQWQDTELIGGINWLVLRGRGPWITINSFRLAISKSATRAPREPYRSPVPLDAAGTIVQGSMTQLWPTDSCAIPYIISCDRSSVWSSFLLQ